MLNNTVARMAVALALAAPVCVAAETIYHLERCTVQGGVLDMRFVAVDQVSRRVSLGADGVMLAGDIKGVMKLADVKSLRLEPTFQITYVSGFRAEYGGLTSQCRDKVVAWAKRLSVVIEGQP